MASPIVDVVNDPKKTLQDAIDNQVPWDELKPHLQAVSQSHLEEEDENSFNILHHAIKADYTEAVHYLFLRGYFMELQQPTQIPYLHLACFYGRTVIVGILLKERPSDFHRGLPPRPFVKNSQNVGWKDIPLTQLKFYSPLDLAAASRQIRCLQLLLNVGHACPSMLESAVGYGSTECVRLLLENGNTTQTELNRAFKLALTRKLPGCLELLLNRGVQASQVLNTMNPFHVMYMYSSGFQLHQDRNEGLAECTEVLIKNGQDVNADYPSGSFPLYSLIHSMVEEKDYNPFTPPVHHIRAMEVLLEAGANPNLDEESLSDSKYSDSSDFFFSFSLGRDPYTSALSAMIVSLEQSDNWEGGSEDWFTPCVERILRHGGNPQRMDRYGDMPLHELMKCLAMQHSEGNLQLDLSRMIRLLLKYGADANVPSSNGILPVNYYFTLMLTLSNGSSKTEQILTKWCSMESPKQVLELFNYMDRDAMHTAHSIISNQFMALAEEGFSNVVTKFVTTEMTKLVQQPRSLLVMCSNQIWKDVERKQDKVEDLPIPKALKHIIIGMFEV